MKRGFRVGLFLLPSLLAVALAACGNRPSPPRAGVTPSGDSAGPEKAGKSAPLTRLLFQDHKTCSLKWADVRVTDQGQLSLDPVADVEGWKKLDAEYLFTARVHCARFSGRAGGGARGGAGWRGADGAGVEEDGGDPEAARRAVTAAGAAGSGRSVRRRTIPGPRGRAVLRRPAER